MRATNAVARKKRHKKVFKAAKGFRAGRSKLYRTAKETLRRAGRYAWVHRRQKKRTFRSLWIVRINAACRAQDITYSAFMSGLKKAGVTLDRKQLAHLAATDPGAFNGLIATAKAS
jgi:large subunit ribosomal protein L20